jgi:hypothetical protein
MRCIPVETLLFGNPETDAGSVALLALMRRAVLRFEGNVHIVYVSNEAFNMQHILASIGCRSLPKYVTIIHPDLVFEAVQNILGRPRACHVPPIEIQMFIDMPAVTTAKNAAPDAKYKWLIDISHKAASDAAYLVESVHLTAYL